MKHLRINGEAEIVCEKCGRAFGFTYDFDPVRAFIYYQYKKFKPEISRFVRSATRPMSVDEWASARYQVMMDTLESYTVSADEEQETEETAQEEEEIE